MGYKTSNERFLWYNVDLQENREQAQHRQRFIFFSSSCYDIILSIIFTELNQRSWFFQGLVEGRGLRLTSKIKLPMTIGLWEKLEIIWPKRHRVTLVQTDIRICCIKFSSFPLKFFKPSVQGYFTFSSIKLKT